MDMIMGTNRVWIYRFFSIFMLSLLDGIGGKMFEKILVTEELLPVREAASQGDLDAMFTLLNHVINGHHTKLCGDTAFILINAMFDHEEFPDNLPRAWATYRLCSQAEHSLYQAGKNTQKEMIERSCDYLQWMIESMICAPRWMWNYELLEYAIQWIDQHTPKIQER